MLRLLTDEDFDGRILRGVWRRCPTADILRVQDVGLRTFGDPVVLAWAAAEDRIVLSQDGRTMHIHASTRVRAGEPMPGVFVLSGKATFAEAIDAIVYLIEASDPSEWIDQIVRIP